MPLVSLPFVFWQLGNNQIFDSQTFHLTSGKDLRLSGHDVVTAL